MGMQFGRRDIATGLTALLLLGAGSLRAEDTKPASGRQSRWDLEEQYKNDAKLPSRAELDEVIKPGRLIYKNGLRTRRLAFESVIKQTMDRNFSQDMLEEVAQLFWTKGYKPVVLKSGAQTQVVELQGDGTLQNRPPPPGALGTKPGEISGGPGGSRTPGGGDPGLIGTEPGGSGVTGLGGREPGDPESRMALARDLENGVHNDILEVLKAKGYNLVALNVFAQTMDLVKVILIVATQDLDDDRIRPTLRDIRSIIENEVLAANWQGVHLAELSSFTLLNERDNHFYEHPVLYWQLSDPAWQGTGPIVPGTLQGETPETGGVATGPVQDYFTSAEFEPEEDFDERALLEGGIGGF